MMIFNKKIEGNPFNIKLYLLFSVFHIFINQPF